MTGREALRWGERCLAPAGWEDSGRVCMLILRQATGLSGIAFLNALDAPLGDTVLAGYQKMVNCAVNGEPVQYILGQWDFYGRTFKTDKRALIPRPETELLVETALKSIPPGEPVKVFDAGCGTGCIGITIKLERPAASVALCDISTDALSLALENAQLLGADVSFITADMRHPFPGGPYDVIVSNPPYINSKDLAMLSPVVMEHEPHMALYGGQDGLDFIRALAGRAEDCLTKGGRLFIEVGYDQADRAMEIMKAMGMAAEAIADYSGILRVISVRKG